jgi:dTDP-4-dehydrorhamnose 3,5-epimerase
VKFAPSPLGGAVIVEAEVIADERGFFSRIFCRDEFAAHGLNPEFVQCSVSFNKRKGTLRGMHYQKKPREEAKLVRCTRGAIYDVIVDLRQDSPTFKHWAGVELSAANCRAIYIPEGIAHGFLTLADESEVFYQMSEIFHLEYTAGVRWNDTAFAIAWPGEICVMSARDRSYPDFGS